MAEDLWNKAGFVEEMDESLETNTQSNPSTAIPVSNTTFSIEEKKVYMDSGMI